MPPHRWSPRERRILAEEALPAIDRAIDRAPKAWTLPRGTAGRVSNVTEVVRRAGLIGANQAGLWRPKR